MTRLIALLTCTLVASAAAQGASCGGQPGLPAGVKPGVYQGTLAGLPVVLELGQYHRYFYLSKGLDIELEAAQSGGKLLLQESTFDQKSQKQMPAACFSLTPSGTGLKGSWTKSGQKAGVPVTLNRVDAAKLPLQLPVTPGLLKQRRDAPYDFLRINHAWTAAAGGRSVREPLSGLSYLRLPGESAALNGALQDLQMQHALSALDCTSNGISSPVGIDFELSQTPLFRTSKLVSFMDSVGYFCGGVHPDAYDQGVILDRLTGEQVRLDDLWPFLNTADLHRLYLAALPAKLNNECRDVLKEREQPSYTFSLSKAGLQVVPTDLPHVVAACAEAVTLPYAKLKDLTYPEQRYYGEFYR